MPMSKKHFEAFAAGIRAELPPTIEADMSGPERDRVNQRYLGLQDAALVFARVAEQDNPRFKRDRFMRACGFGV